MTQNAQTNESSGVEIHVQISDTLETEVILGWDFSHHTGLNVKSHSLRFTFGEGDWPLAEYITSFGSTFCGAVDEPYSCSESLDVLEPTPQAEEYDMIIAKDLTQEKLEDMKTIENLVSEYREVFSEKPVRTRAR